MDLLDRAPVLDTVHRWLHQAADGHGRCLLLGGEAGVGKTALIRCFSEAVQASTRVLIGACDALSTPRPLGPLLDFADADPGLNLLLLEHAPRDLLFRTVMALLDGDRARTGRPTLLVIEDAHWADEATFDLVRYLGRRVGSLRALIVVTYREDEVGPHHPLRQISGDLATSAAVSRMSLPPLSADAVATLVAGSGIDAAALYARTGGNAFFVTEVIAAGGAIPATVRDAVLARAARLSPAARAVVDAAAVIGSPIDPSLLDQIKLPNADARDECLTGGMLQTAGSALAFRHELARDATLDAIPAGRRAGLHAAVLRALAAAPPELRDPARLAHHAEEAGDRAAVLRWAPEAARRAAALRAHREAAAQYARALRYAIGLPPPEHAALLEAHSYECYLTAQIEEAIASRQSALAIAVRRDDGRKEGENRCHMALLHWAATRIDDAEREAAVAVAALEALPPGSELAMAYATLARLRGTTLDDEQAIAWGERAIALAESLGATETLVDALITVGAAKLAAGDEVGREQLERSITLATAAGLDDLTARAHANLGFGYSDHFRFAHAARYFAAGIAFCSERDLDYFRQHLTAWLAHCRLYLGEWDEAADLAGSVLAAPNVAPVTRFAALLVAALVRVRRGEPHARSLLDEGLALAVGSGTLQRLGPIRAARAEAVCLKGDHRQTAAEALAVYDLAIERNKRWFAGELAYWRWCAGDLVVPPSIAAAPFALQIAGDWAAAAAAWDELACPYEAARARAESDNPMVLRQALATFEQLRARPAATLVRRRLRLAGAAMVSRGPRPSTRANSAHLTRRQLEIVRLLVHGHSNQQIADHLFLSPRTIENHVASILSKLGVASRADAAREAIRLGLVTPN